jgi:transposase
MSGLGRYIVDAVVERRSPTQLARDHGISKRWVFELLRRFKVGGYEALEPRSRRPRSCSHQVEAKVEELIVKLRCELAAAGHDAGPETIAHHLKSQVDKVPSVATVWRILKRNGLITLSRTSDRKLLSSVSKPSSPTRPGSSTQRHGSSPTAARSRSSTSSMTSPGSHSPLKP